MNPRLKNIRIKLAQERLDGLLLSSPANISYLINYQSRDSFLVITKDKEIYITDSRYTEEARLYLKGGIIIKKIDGSVFKTIAEVLGDLNLKRTGFEERYLPFADYRKIRDNLKRDMELIPVYGLVEVLRQIKDAEEISKIKKGLNITFKALHFIQDFIKPGKKEIEIAAEIERFIRYNGASGAAFEIIVASGPNSAFPHHITSQRKIKENEPVLIDMGVDYSGYKTDLTRTFFLGKINTLFKKVYRIVSHAQERALRLIKPGVALSRLDLSARQYITQKGYGGFFGHNLGHGVGLETHEAPQISGKETAKAMPGMVFTVEPGIYIPGRFGIRIEDMVLVTRKGVELLSGTFNK